MATPSRSCGRRGQPAAAMLNWGGHRSRSAGAAKQSWRGRSTTTLWCAFNDVHLLEGRPQVPHAGVLVEARLIPVPKPAELPPRRSSLAGRFLGALGRMLRPGSGRRSGNGDHQGDETERDAETPIGGNPTSGQGAARTLTDQCSSRGIAASSPHSGEAAPHPEPLRQVLGQQERAAHRPHGPRQTQKRPHTQ